MSQMPYEQPSYDGGRSYPPPTDPKYNYPPPSVPPPAFTQAQSMSDGGGKFNPRPKYRDLWAAILFLLHFAAFIAVSVIALRNYMIIQHTSVRQVTLNWSTIYLLLVCAGVGFFLSVIYLALAQKYPKRFIIVTFIISIILYWALAVFYFVKRYFSVAILTAIVAVFYTTFYYSWRPFIPFSSVMLKAVTDITNKYKSVLLVAFGGLFAETIFTIWWIFTFIGAYQLWYPEACRTNQTTEAGCENEKLILIVIFLLFSFYWTSQVIQTWIHVTTSGVFATYYFLEGTPEGVPSSPTLKSARRASTTSFGSICLGSLLVAILQVIHALLRFSANDSDNPLGAFCAACAAAIISFIESLLEYFNFYAYTQVAIYGKTFWESAKDTWKLIKDRGVEAIINDNLIGNVLAMGAILVGIITALLAYLYMIVFKSFIEEGFTTLVVFLGFIVGLQLMTIMGSVISSGTATTFVCLAEDPNALARTKPELYNMIRDTYPRFIAGM